MPIPRIIHQTYKDYELPELFEYCQSAIRELHPGFDYRFYTDADIDRFIRTEFPDYYDAFQRLPRTIMKIDMVRYFIMYKFGGIYADMDYLMLRPFDLLEHAVVLPANKEDSAGNPTCVGNCFFASVPNHPFWKTLMDSLFTVDRTKLDYSIDKHVDDHILGTGPMFVYYMWRKYSRATGAQDSLVPKKELFHPPTEQTDAYVEKLREAGVYGVHMCTGVWRENTL